MNYIKTFQNAHDLSVSVGNSYSGYQLMHIFLDNFFQGGKYTAQNHDIGQSASVGDAVGGKSDYIEENY